MIFMYLSKKPQPPKYTLAPFLFLNVVSLMNGELFSTSSTDRLHVTLLTPIYAQATSQFVNSLLQQ